MHGRNGNCVGENWELYKDLAILPYIFFTYTSFTFSYE